MCDSVWTRDESVVTGMREVALIFDISGKKTKLKRCNINNGDGAFARAGTGGTREWNAYDIAVMINAHNGRKKYGADGREGRIPTMRDFYFE